MNIARYIPPRDVLALDEIADTSIRSITTMKECVTRFSETSTGSAAVTVSSIHKIWDEVAGADVCQHVKVRNVRDGILNVVADHPAWSTQLKYIHDELVSKINTHLGENKISSIYLSVAR